MNQPNSHDRSLFDKLYPNSAQQGWLDQDNVNSLAEAYRNNAQVPPIVAREDGMIIEGHHRHKAAQIAGVVPDIIVISRDEFNEMRSEGMTLDEIESTIQSQARQGDREVVSAKKVTDLGDEGGQTPNLDHLKPVPKVGNDYRGGKLATPIQVGPSHDIAGQVVKQLQSQWSTFGKDPRPNQSPWSSFAKKPAGDSASSSQYNATSSHPSGWPVREIRDSSMRSPYSMALANCGPYSMRSSHGGYGHEDIGQRQARLQAMEDRSRKITQHENKHSDILRDVSPQAKPQLTQTRGPDGRQYAVAGEVNADLSPIPGRPKATEMKAEAVYRSALHDSDKSDEDVEAGRAAMFAAQAARQKSLQSRHAQLGMRSPEAMDVDHGDSDSDSDDDNVGMMSHLRNCRPKMKSSHEKAVKPVPEPFQYGSAGMQSPDNPGKVKMKAAPFAAIAAGAGRFLAGAAFRGAMASGRLSVMRRAAKVARYFRSAPSSRMGKMLSRRDINGRMVDSRLSLLTRSTQELQRGFDTLERTTGNLNQQFERLIDRIQKFSPEITMQQARNEMALFSQSLRHARRLGPMLAEWEKNRGRMQLAGNDIQANLTEIFLPTFNMFQSIATSLTELLAWVTGGAAQVATSIRSALQPLFDSVSNALTEVLKYIGIDVAEMNRRAREKEQKELKDAVAGNLNSFFNMQVPGPFAEPNLQNNPEFGMPLFLPPPPGVGP